jgi:hypothetical protein
MWLPLVQGALWYLMSPVEGANIVLSQKFISIYGVLHQINALLHVLTERMQVSFIYSSN